MIAEPASETSSAWQLDPVHSLVEFSAKHLMVTTVKGRFKGVQGTIIVDEADPARSSVEVEIDAASLDTGQEMRDNHLRSADFLEVDKYATITFRSIRIEQLGDTHGLIFGNLTFRDVTREVVLDAQFTGRAKSPWGTEVMAFEATTTINRKDFGLNWNVALEAGGFLVGDTIKIEVAVEAIKQP